MTEGQDVQETAFWKLMDSTMEVVFEPAWKWSPRLRKAYVLTWPLSVVVRVVAGTAVLLTMIVVYIACSAYDYFQSVWRGRPSKMFE